MEISCWDTSSKSCAFISYHNDLTFVLTSVLYMFIWTISVHIYVISCPLLTSDGTILISWTWDQLLRIMNHFYSSYKHVFFSHLIISFRKKERVLWLCHLVFSRGHCYGWRNTCPMRRVWDNGACSTWNRGSFMGGQQQLLSVCRKVSESKEPDRMHSGRMRASSHLRKRERIKLFKENYFSLWEFP